MGHCDQCPHVVWIRNWIVSPCTSGFSREAYVLHPSVSPFIFLVCERMDGNNRYARPLVPDHKELRHRQNVFDLCLAHILWHGQGSISESVRRRKSLRLAHSSAVLRNLYMEECNRRSTMKLWPLRGLRLLLLHQGTSISLSSFMYWPQCMCKELWVASTT